MEPTEENLRAWEQSHESLAPIVEPAVPEAAQRHLPELAGRHVLVVDSPARAIGELLAAGGLVTAVVGREDLAAVHAEAPSAAAVQGDPNELPLELRRGRFDVVYAGDASLEFVTDIEGFANGIAGALRPGGRLVLHDRHPVALALDEPGLAFRADYFAGISLGAIVSAVAAAGLTLHTLEEHASLYRSRLTNRRVPGDFLLVADKP
jgi:SAM-dependent methyltransferase